ncbi:hypothetical protein GCM10023188_17170 [Pontibacter saemangeumensis]|uniref:Carboxypeptidase regulatory-like domain-containing protein n=1 Tax=Pontibacter saemangeumensis TaxID=1084525 RepID=A0ABP8LKI5_9BACT
MKTNLLLPLLLLLLLGGCVSHEDDFISKYCPGSCTVIKGRLTTDEGTQPLAGVKLNAYWRSDRGTFKIGYAERRKAVAITDPDGNFELRFLLRDDELNAQQNYEGYIVVSPVLEENQYFICGGLDFIFKSFELKRSTTTTLDYNLPQKALLDIAPKNLQAMQAGDAFAINLEFTSGIDNAESCSSLFGFAGSNNAQQPVPVPANQPLTLRITRTRNGTTTETTEILHLKPGERFSYAPAF